jgi:Tol biopolymer transport system component
MKTILILIAVLASITLPAAQPELMDVTGLKRAENCIVYSASIGPEDESTARPTTEICLVTLDGKYWARLTDNDADDIAPSFSPDGQKIAFNSYRDWHYEISVMNADGSAQTRLTNNVVDYDEYTDDSNLYPVFSPDGRKIAFIGKRDVNWEIYVMNADGSGQTRLTYESAVLFPTFSHDGSRIVFEDLRDGEFEIYVMNADGSGQTRLTYNDSRDMSPAFSPDGRMVAFVSFRDGNYEIYVMNADGSEQTRLTYKDAGDFDPVFSPDGRKIAFDSERDGKLYIYVMNADGSGQTRLTYNDPGDFAPVFSPDGSKIAFYSERDGNKELYVMNADGSAQTRLTYNDVDDSDLAFSPMRVGGVLYDTYGHVIEE